jgi:sodium/potassium-transporting ATPase subunit beta
MVHCAFNMTKKPGQSCVNDLNEYGPCTKSNSYGYNSNSPCFFLHLSTNYDWSPEYYDSNELPSDMPTDLKNYIRKLSTEQPKMVLQNVFDISSCKIFYMIENFQLNSIWISCEPRFRTTDAEMGNVRYYPYRGFPGYFYPRDAESYQAPLMALYFENPERNNKNHYIPLQ